MLTSQAVKELSGLDTDSLDKYPLDIVLAEPSFDGTKLINLEVVWANTKVLSRPNVSPVGLQLTTIYPYLVDSDWLEHLNREFLREPRVNVPIKQLVFGPSKIPYELTAFWAGELLYAHVNELDPNISIEQGMDFALRLIFDSLQQLSLAASYELHGHTKRYASAAFLEGLKVSKEFFETASVEQLVYPEDFDTFEAWEAQKFEANVSVRILGADSIYRWVDVSASPIRDLVGNTHGILYSFVDMHDQKSLAEKLERSRDLRASELSVLTQALNVSRDGFAIWTLSNVNGRPSYTLDFINDAGAKPTGRAATELIGLPLDEVLPDDWESLAELFADALTSGEQRSAVVEVDSETGWVGAYENKVVPLGQNQLVTNFRDVSDDMREKNRLAHLANHDHLTGLINRPALEDALYQKLANLSAHGSQFGFAFVDIDNFKQINDSLGHLEGDEVLKEFGDVLTQTLEGRGQVSRISGDEFALIIDDAISQESCSDLMDKLRINVADYFSKTKSLKLSFSAGVVWVIKPNSLIPEVLRVADRAMYSSKNKGRDCYTVVQI